MLALAKSCFQHGRLFLILNQELFCSFKFLPKSDANYCKFIAFVSVCHSSL